MNPFLELFDRSGVIESAVMQAAVDNDAVGAPEGVMQLDQFGARNIHKVVPNSVEFAPHRPSLVEDCM